MRRANTSENLRSMAKFYRKGRQVLFLPAFESGSFAYFAYSMALVSRRTWTLIVPG